MTINSIKYRAEIDGLRAIAVGLVLLYHFFPTRMSGGFVGVDVFFVISGFLISKIVMVDLAQGKFSLLDFYAKRIKRIFPSLATMLIITLIAGLCFFGPNDQALLQTQTVASLFFAANIYFWNGAGYFNSESELNPLLHLWSLGIEEQYYLIFPFVFLLATRIGPKITKYFWLALTCCSFFICLWLSNRAEPAAYFAPWSRAWELLAGVCLTTLQSQGQPFFSKLSSRIERFVCELICLFALAALFYAALSFSSSTIFPGFAALIPVAATAILLAFLPRTSTLVKIFRIKILVWLGKISYPTYLVHWPIIVIWKIVYFGDFPTVARLFGLLASICLGWIFYRFVEAPFRNTRSSDSKIKRNNVLKINKVKISLLLYSVALLFAVFYKPIAKDFTAEDFSAVVRNQLQAGTRNNLDGEWRRGECFLLPGDRSQMPQSGMSFDSKCYFDEHKKKLIRVALVGDSFAAALYPALKLHADSDNIQIMQLTAGACIPFINEFTSYNLRVATKRCEGLNKERREALIKYSPDIIIVAANYYAYSEQDGWKYDDFPAALFASLSDIQKHLTDTKIFVIGQPPSFKTSVPRIVEGMSKDGYLPDRIPLSFMNDIGKIETIMQLNSRTNGFGYIPVSAFFCNDQGCNLKVGPSLATDLISYDYGHLSPNAANAIYKSEIEAHIRSDSKAK